MWVETLNKKLCFLYLWYALFPFPIIPFDYIVIYEDSI